jgi:hypothetical protein
VSELGLCKFPRCKKPIIEGEKFVTAKNGDGSVHNDCLAEWQAQAERDREELRRREHATKVTLALSRLKSSFDSCLVGTSIDWGQPLLHFPQMPYADFGNAAWREKCHPKVLNVIEQWDMESSMLILGPTGSGKTSCIRARLYAEFERRTKLVEADGESRSFSFAYTTGLELQGCRRRARIGDEAELVKVLNRHRLIIIDEVGFEPPGEELMAVIDRHYLDGGVIVMCSGLTLEAFDAKYGGALRRRVVERGVLLNAHPKQKGQVRVAG